MNNIYSNIELVIDIEPKISSTNTANYKQLSNWNGSAHGNVTTTGSNGPTSAYGVYDMAGQVYEWTDSNPFSILTSAPSSSLFKSGASIKNNNIKILRGGSFADTEHVNLSKNNKKELDLESMIDYGCIGLRVATNELPNDSISSGIYTIIANTGNAPDNCTYGLDAKLGQVNYLYAISKQLVTNDEYCTYLNTIDTSGTQPYNIYDTRMTASPVGGILFDSCAPTGSKYIVKNNFENKPVTFIKWIMAAQYCNWLTNGKDSFIENIKVGSYDLQSLYLTSKIIDTNNDGIIDILDISNILSQNPDLPMSVFDTAASGCYRQNTARYFLPSENEWYKAAYYDGLNDKYWNYPTQNDDPPAATICDISGLSISYENQKIEQKIIPILLTGSGIIDESNKQDIKYLIENSIDSNWYNRYNNSLSDNYCPSIEILPDLISGISGNYTYPLTAKITNLNIGQKYSYEFSSLGSNWPTSIQPISGTFIAAKNNFNINAILKLKPNDIYDNIVFNTNLDYNHLEQQELRIYKDINIYNNLRLSINTENCSECAGTARLSVDQNTLPIISQLDKAGISFQSPSSKNTIAISGGLCEQYIPLVMTINNPQPGKLYKYVLTSNETGVIFMPNSGIAAFGGGSGNPNRIVSLAALNDTTSAVVKVDLSRIDISYNVADYIGLQCLESCDNAYQNYANYNNKAIWGYCQSDCAGKAPELRRFASITRVGTNGGPSTYGTYDQDGNILELCYIPNNINVTGYVYRGGSFNSTIVGKYARFSFDSDSSDEYSDYIGFRVGSYSNPYNFSGMIPITDIGSPPTGNVLDYDTGYGSVNYSYQIGIYPVNNSEYAQFLNSTATTGYNGLIGTSPTAVSWVYNPLMSGCYGGIDRSGSGTIASPYSYTVQSNMSYKPVRFINRKMSCRYINWLHNNKINGWNNQQSGVYTFTANTNDFATSGYIRSSCGLYFIPDENEWYKAAYYAGGNTNNTSANYWIYATQSNSLPGVVTATSTGHGIIPN